jgi:hypothetical protein
MERRNETKKVKKAEMGKTWRIQEEEIETGGSSKMERNT